MAQLRENLCKVQSRMKQFANAHRSEREFQVGDWVNLKLQPYRQSSMAIRRHLKLSSRFYGPYKVEAKVGSVAYPSSESSAVTTDGSYLFAPAAILDSRMLTSRYRVADLLGEFG
ncbi:hypothetical protein V2J09_008801 [Rumex salicifolius]